MENGCILQARHGATCVFAFVGEIRYPLGPSLSGQLDELFRRADFDDILIDLSAATCIDSTCLGLLARVGNFMRSRFQRKPVLLCPRPDIGELLDCLGFDQVFAIRQETRPPPEGAREIGATAPAGERELAWTVLEAHRTLSELNEANRLRFKDVIAAIEAELAQQQGRQDPDRGTAETSR
jgi:anti-anti-sigma regulatory factor